MRDRQSVSLRWWMADLISYLFLLCSCSMLIDILVYCKTCNSCLILVVSLFSLNFETVPHGRKSDDVVLADRTLSPAGTEAISEKAWRYVIVNI